MRLRFSKMHGLGNDFMVVDLVTQHWEPDAKVVRALADRRTGVGFDQLLLVMPPTEPDADFYYRILNADGSDAEMCGNGVRCVGQFIQHHQLSRKNDIRLQTTGGRVELALAGAGMVDVALPPPNLVPEQLPLQLAHCEPDPKTAQAFTLETSFGPTSFVPVNVSNPHAVVFVDSIHRAPVEDLGPLLEVHPAFPERVNVGFCEVVDRGFIRLRVFERGVGETRACGTGACAAVVAACITDRTGTNVKVSLTGGKLRIGWNGPDQDILMTGPTCLVFDAQADV